MYRDDGDDAEVAMSTVHFLFPTAPKGRGAGCAQLEPSRSVQKFNRPSLQPLLTLSDLHPHPLTLHERGQSAALKRRRMHEHILPAAVLPDEAKPLVTI